MTNERSPQAPVAWDIAHACGQLATRAWLEDAEGEARWKAEICKRFSEASLWIPVGERLPPKSEAPLYVLAVDAKGRMSVGYCIIGYYSEPHHWFWVFAKSISEPTHWMPLPEAPK